MYDIIFVGAGPIGLWTAIQTKLLKPSLRIVMFEKYEVYKRNNILHVDRTSLIGSINDPEFNEISRSFVGDVETQVMETKLKTYALKLGIEIKYKNITGEVLKELKNEYSDVKIIVGSDGSHSIVRDKIFGDDFNVNYNIRHVMEIKYITKNQSLQKDKLSWKYQSEIFAKYNHYIKEQITENVNESPFIKKVTVRFFINNIEEFEAIKDASFKNPYNLDTLKEKSPFLFEMANAWINARKTNNNDNPDETIGIKVSAIKLDIYKTKDVIKFDDYHNGLVYILVGDSSFGVPFFRSLNAGLLEGSILAHKMCQYLDENCDMFNNKIVSMIDKSLRKTRLILLKSFDTNRTVLDDYTIYVNQLTRYEILKAVAKNNMITSVIASTMMSAESTEKFKKINLFEPNPSNNTIFGSFGHYIKYIN